MMVAVLLGALSLGACVDDNESASVTDLREAKAEQLRSIVKMNEAEAQAKLIYANAEAELKTAEANLKQALADKAAAEARIKDLEAQLKQDTYDAELAAKLAEAEKARLEAEKEIASIQGEMQKNQLKLEKEIANLQKQLLQAQLELQNQEDGMANAAMERLKKLATNYSTLLYSYTEEQNNLNNLKTNMAKMEADLLDWQTAKEQTIARNNATIALIDQQIALFKEYTNYTEDLEALQNDATLKLTELNQAIDVRDNAKNAFDEAEQEVSNDQALAEQLAAINDNDLIKMLSYSYSSNYNVDVNGDGYADIYFTSYNPVSTFSNVSMTIENEDYPNNPYSYTGYELTIEAKDLRPLRIAVNAAVEALDIDSKSDRINNATTGLQKLYNEAVAASAEAKRLSDAAPSNEDLYNNWVNAVNAEKSLESQLNSAKQQLAEAQETASKLESLYDLVAGNTDALAKAVEDYNTAALAANEPVAELHFAHVDAVLACQEISAEYSAIQAVLYGTGSTNYMTLNDYLIQQMGGQTNEIWTTDREISFVAIYDDGTTNWYIDSGNYWVNIYTTLVTTSTGLNGAIDIQEDLIDPLEDEKARLLAENEDYQQATTYEQSLALEQAKIDGKTAVIDVIEIQLNQAKIALDAAVSQYETEEPSEDQPAEEQPAA